MVIRDYDSEPIEVVDKVPTSLAYKLGAEGNIRWHEMSACTLTYEDNPAELITVWIAEKPRTAIVEVTEPAYKLGSRFGVRSYA